MLRKQTIPLLALVPQKVAIQGRNSCLLDTINKQQITSRTLLLAKKKHDARARLVINSALLCHRRAIWEVQFFDCKHYQWFRAKIINCAHLLRKQHWKTTRMRLQGEMPRESDCRFQERKAEKINSEGKSEAKMYKSSGILLTENLHLSIIQPTVIQALPCAQRTLPSLQSIAKQCRPNSPAKKRKARPKPGSAGRRILPSLPRIDDLTLPKIQSSTLMRVGASASQLQILPTIEEQSLPSVQLPDTKVRMRVKRVRRLLPSIPPTETRTPPSIPATGTRTPPNIQPTAVKPLPKRRRERRKPMLPSLPTIDEQMSPKPADETTRKAAEQSSAIAENEVSLAPRKKESTLSKLQPIQKSTLESVQQEQKGESLSRKEKFQSPEPTKTEPRRKTKKVANGPQPSIQLEDKDKRPGLKQIDTDRGYLHNSEITRMNREKMPRIHQETVDQKPARSSVKRRAKDSPKTTEDRALPRLQATIKLTASRRSREKEELPRLRKKEAFPNPQNKLDHNLPRPSVMRGNKANSHWPEREVPQIHNQSAEKEDMLSIHSKINQTRRRNMPSLDSYALLSCRWRESAATLQNLQQQKNEEKPSCRPKVNRNRTSLLSANSYALLNLKRREFEILPRLQLTRNQTGPQPSTKDRDTRILTVKPALLSIQPKEDSAVFSKPLAAPTIKKGLPSARTNMKRGQPRIQAMVSRPLPSIQPIVKQVLPILNSSSLQELVKKPLPSVQPEACEESYCSQGSLQTAVKTSLQPLVTETEQNSSLELR